MALFDFPRIHFKGEMEINVATINNAATFPLTIYDATRSRPFLPPRLYFSSKDIIEGVPSPLEPDIHYDEVNGFYYLEVVPINTIELLRKWCMTPLCSDPSMPDIAYQPYYAAAEKDKALQPHLPLLGHCPGYWNMYGDMGVTMKHAKAASVQRCEKDPVTNQYAVKNYFPTSSDLPPDIQELLNATIDFDSVPQRGMTTATMCETVSNQSVFAYIFCSTINVTSADNPEHILLQGEPYRFQPMLYGTWKVLNWLPPMASSCRYSTAIPIVGRSPKWMEPIARFMMENRLDKTIPLKGVVVSFTVEQVFEYRYNPKHYLENGTKPNPVKCITTCTITPWQEKDMRSAELGRYLVAQGCENILEKPIPIQFTPALSRITPLPDGTAVYTLDMGNTWPEAISPPLGPTPKERATTPPRDSVTFDTYDLGRLSLRYGDAKNTEFGHIGIDPINNPLQSVLDKGNLFDFHIKDPAALSNITDNYLHAYLNDKKVLTEVPYYITSDQKGLYAEEGDLPQNGYISYNETREPCRLRILQKGIPVSEPVELILAQWNAPEAGNDPMSTPNTTRYLWVKDHDIVQLSLEPLDLSNNGIYYFAYPDQYPDNVIPAYASAGGNYTIFDTGAFVAMRVHPHRDYSQYLNPDNWGTTPPDWEVVYEEVFKLYDVVYPAMSQIHPWKKEVWNNGTMAGLVLQRTDLSIWNDILYMPKSRELSGAQRELLKAWANYVNQQKNEQT